MHRRPPGRSCRLGSGYKDRQPLSAAYRDDVVHYIVIRLKTLLKDDESGFRRYIDMLEILSENRELRETIKDG